MSLAYAAVEPQPSLAWTFESSNVDYVTNLSPSAQVSPGPAQLVGSAALVTNAPTSNTAVSFPGTAGNYMLINSTPATFDLATSNLFVECWVYFNSFSPQYQCIVANGPTGSGTNQECWIIRINPSTAVDFIINSSAVKTATSSALLTTGQWYHIAASYNSGSSIGYVFINGGTPNSVSLVTPKTSTGASLTLGAYPSPISAAYTMNGYIRDLRVVQGGIVPTGTFVPSAAPFTYALPSYVSGSGSVVFTLLGQFITYVPGKYNQAILFQGVQGVTPPTSNVVYTLSNPISVNNGCTLSFWVNVSTYLSSSGQGNFIYAITSAGNGIRLYYNWPGGGNPQQFLCQFYYGGSSATYIVYSGVTINTWYHYTCVIQSNGVNLFYINGNLVGTDSSAVGLVSNPTNITRIIVGSATGYNQFIGLIDDLRVYNTALTAAQIQSIYSQGGAPASQFRVMSQPSLAWQFDSTLGPYIGSVSSTTQRGTLNYVPGKYISALNIQNPTGTTSNSINWGFTSPISIDTGFSFSCWVRFNDLSYLTVIQQFVTFYNGTNNPLRIQINASQGLMQAQFNDSVDQKNVNMFFPAAGTWYHLALVGNAGNITVYLNGTTTYGLTYVQSGITFNNASLGLATSFNGQSVTNADFDDFRVYSSALSATQVQSIYASQGMPGRGVSSTYLPTLPGYSYVPFSALPSSFTLTQTSTGNAWTINTGTNQIRDGNWGGDPVLTLTAIQPSDIYSARNKGIWYALGGNGNYVRHSGFVMFTNGYAAQNLDFAWAFFLQNGTTNQVKIWNPFNNAIGNWVQSGTYTAGRVAINTTDPNQAHIYTISSPTSSTSLRGIPLFSQLSSAATSSAVGAFSLRAVNGVSTRAVAVQAHPVVQWPPIAMTSNNFTATGTYNGVINGVYTVTASVPNNTIWYIFDNNINTYYEQATAFPYNNATGTYIGSNATTISSVSVLGEWFQVQLPTSIILRSYTLVGRQDNFWWANRNPTTFWIAGSTDGTTWSNVHQQTNITPPQQGITINIPTTSNSLSYSYYRLVVNVIGNSNTGVNQRNLVNLSSWNLYGDAPSYAPNAAQDFYADRLGNLLTQPVIGQSLSNWLGGATGYVTTWYDQSGRGNHATQATAAKQPVIQKATKGPGYCVYFSGSTTSSQVYLSGFSYSVLNNTNYSIISVTKRTQAPATETQSFLGTSTTLSKDGALAMGYENNSARFVVSQYVDDTHYTIPAFTTSAAEPILYWSINQSSTSGRYGYSSSISSSITSGDSGTSPASYKTLLNATSGNLRIGSAANYNYFYTGEIYELLVFTNSLYDLDNTGGIITQIYNNQLSYTGT